MGIVEVGCRHLGLKHMITSSIMPVLEKLEEKILDTGFQDPSFTLTLLLHGQSIKKQTNEMLKWWSRKQEPEYMVVT